MKEKSKSLDDLATSFLRSKGFTWAGNDKSTSEFKEIVENRKEERFYCIGSLGKSKKKSGIISPRKRR